MKGRKLHVFVLNSTLREDGYMGNSHMCGFLAACSYGLTTVMVIKCDAD